jgi:hypothetical protein
MKLFKDDENITNEDIIDRLEQLEDLALSGKLQLTDSDEDFIDSIMFRFVRKMTFKQRRLAFIILNKYKKEIFLDDQNKENANEI